MKRWIHASDDLGRPVLLRNGKPFDIDRMGPPRPDKYHDYHIAPNGEYPGVLVSTYKHETPYGTWAGRNTYHLYYDEEHRSEDFDRWDAARAALKEYFQKKGII